MNARDPGKCMAMSVAERCWRERVGSVLCVQLPLQLVPQSCALVRSILNLCARVYVCGYALDVVAAGRSSIEFMSAPALCVCFVGWATCKRVSVQCLNF